MERGTFNLVKYETKFLPVPVCLRRRSFIASPGSLVVAGVG